MKKIPKRSKPPSGVESFPDAKSKTETASYMPLEARVKALQHAGQILQASREQQFDGTGEDYVAPPMRGLQPDLADLSQLARENAERMNIIKQRVYDKKLRQEKAKQEEEDSPENDENPEKPKKVVEKTKNDSKESKKQTPEESTK